ncbi:hypothetical protein HRbin08_01927 [bacterium HR08]|nr:hypothetical protein HRbin08_01927 [bacterium HR08]
MQRSPQVRPPLTAGAEFEPRGDALEDDLISIPKKRLSLHRMMIHRDRDGTTQRREDVAALGSGDRHKRRIRGESRTRPDLQTTAVHHTNMYNSVTKRNDPFLSLLPDDEEDGTGRAPLPHHSNHRLDGHYTRPKPDAARAHPIRPNGTRCSQGADPGRHTARPMVRGPTRSPSPRSRRRGASARAVKS